jgi:PAS domain S-box-containing protein
VKPRVLIVDDSLTVRMDLSEALAAAGFDPIPCVDLATARTALAADSFLLVILDVLLPDGDGLDLLEELKRSSRTAAIPVLLLSTEAEVKSRVRGIGAGADEYIGKPYDLGQVIARARALVQATPRTGPGPGRQVLLIDDSATFRNELRHALEDAGYKVQEAATGEEGLALAAVLRLDAVVVDGVLPGIDGVTVVRRLKSDSALRSTPCLLLTAAEGADEELRSLDAGADAYVRKSEDLGIILVRLAALLRRTFVAGDETGASLLGPKRLLAVDDSVTYLTELGSQLRREGYDVVLAESGEEALELLAVQPVDCILLDLIMPGMSGQDTCRRIKQSTELRDIPLVMLTGRDDRDAMIEGINAGADDYIAKSADFDILKARLRAQLRRKHFEDENRQIREKLVRRETEARFQKLIHSNIIGVIVGDLDGHLTDANDAFLSMLGYSRAELEAGALRSDILTPLEWRQRDEAAIAQVRKDGSVAPFAKELFRKDGLRLPIVLGLVRLESSDTTVGFVLDRTEQKAAEERIKNYTLALEAANRELAKANDQAEQASRAKSSFLANMSHELRTPLNAIIGFAELLHDGHVSPELPQHKEFLGDILTSGRHLLQLINDVLDLSKVEAGKLEFHPETVALGTLIGEVLAILRTIAAEKQIWIETLLDPDVGNVVIDPSRFKQVLYNYVSNALKFTAAAGRISVRTMPEGGEAFRLEVEDTGTGIAEDDVGRLFAEFSQLDAGAAKKHAGTGLGLALTKRLVEAQGGSVGLRSIVGTGSTFHAILPRRPANSRPAPASDAVPGNPGAPVILVIEDNERDRDSIVRSLAAAGFAVETAATGAQALAKCRTRVFDAITLDLLLPDQNGIDVLRAIRAAGTNREVPVIVITVVTERGAIAGVAVHDVLGKPLDEALVIESLGRAGVRPERGGSVLVIDDDPSSSRLMAATLAQLGYRATCVQGAAEGLRVAATSAPTAIVLDLLMPDMDGFAFLDEFRRLAHCEGVPVIVWSSKDLSSEEYARLSASAQAVLQKGRDVRATMVEELRAALSLATRSGD